MIAVPPGPIASAHADPRVHVAASIFGASRLLSVAAVVLIAALFYTLRGIFLPLFLAFLLAYALDPIVDRLERIRVPRSVGAPLVMLALVAAAVTVVFLGVPFLVSEVQSTSSRLPEQLDSLRMRVEELLWARFHYRLPETWNELVTAYGADLRRQLPDTTRIKDAVFGTVNLIFVLLGGLLIPVFALYLLGDFDRIVQQAERLVPRRWAPAEGSLFHEIHLTLGRWVRGQLICSILLATLYATGLSIVGIRLAVPIGVMDGFWVCSLRRPRHGNVPGRPDGYPRLAIDSPICRRVSGDAWRGLPRRHGDHATDRRRQRRPSPAGGLGHHDGIGHALRFLRSTVGRAHRCGAEDSSSTAPRRPTSRRTSISRNRRRPFRALRRPSSSVGGSRRASAATIVSHGATRGEVPAPSVPRFSCAPHRARGGGYPIRSP